VFIPRTVEVQVWIIEERCLKVMEMQEPQEYAQINHRRGDGVSQAKERYNCYTENIVSNEVEIMET